ncbi:hypothetical protein Vadar_021702 [Vaccinium darrowii]|uniref:Uncharacterized protein n=1 Tax=Vaccinium darrowii TaxID=229202 RepID=A0ACB7Y272_9ERIC|nr:hypothetical protein Vadar_021702 [Vaccinium darrowii]
MGHQDKELRYCFIYNPYPNLHEENIIGKRDAEVFTGAGVEEIQDFKREVLERGLPATRDSIGVNYMGMEVTDQVQPPGVMIPAAASGAVLIDDKYLVAEI